MKKYLLVISMLLAIAATFAQTGKKPPAKEKPPTQKEMADMMKEMQAAMNEMSPEDKKMMDSMGIKMPDTKSIQKNMSGISDAQLKKAYDDENRIVPKRDAVRISAVPKAVTDSKMGAYIAAIQNKLASTFKPAVISMGNKAYDYIKSNSKNVGEAGNMAMGLWLAGKPELALYVLGKLCATNAGNTDNLSNYSAMLSMQGAQHLAIPILNNLNARYPKNSTLLNNLGQAWFGLGEIGNAEKYIDSAIRIYAYHPQANLTKSLIEESKGNRKGAIDATKRSIAKAYSMDKENRLNKLGYKLDKKDLVWDRPMPQDPLGLEKFKWPEYPMNVAESEVLEVEWDAFKKKCQEEKDELEMQEKTLEKVVKQANDARTKQLLQAGQRGIMIEPLPRFAHKAMAKLGYLVVDKDGHIAFSYQQKGQAVANANIEVAKFEDILSNQIEALGKQYEDDFGEGKPNPFEAACADYNKANNSFLSSSNTLLRDAFNDFLAFMRRKINNEMYYYQYTMWPENFELAKVQAKISWLSLLQNQNPRFKDKNSWCQDKTDVEAKPFKLSKFDDIACKYKSKLDLKIITIENNCSRMTSEFDFMFLNYVRKDDFERAEGDTYISSTFKVSVEAGKDLKAGPLKVEAKMGAGVELEFGRTGLEDVTLIGEAKVGAGTSIFDEDEKSDSPGIGIAGKDAFPTTVEAGVEGRVSLISGHGEIGGSGILKGMKITEW
ncbi:tetratricopeptide repeat protein [Terrimonas alba]|uniref:tetratricopeptide repeat protein n=1 Tax=Terrimonas alba TaxID=3349636 RepID=UPI0035F48D53